MTSESDSIASEILALRAEAEHGPADAVKARLFSRLEASIPAVVGAAVGTAALSKLESGGLSSATGASVPAKLWLVGMFALGGAVGAGAVTALDRPEEPRVVYVDRLVTAKAASPTIPVPVEENGAPAPSPVSEKEQAVQAPLAGVQHATRAPSPHPDAAHAAKGTKNPPADEPRNLPSPARAAVDPASLAEQQALLDQARAALGKGNGRAALEAVHAHVGRFPQSVLTEEREAIAIKALANVGRRDEARSRLELFEKRFPRSPLLPSVRTVVLDPVTEKAR